MEEKFNINQFSLKQLDPQELLCEYLAIRYHYICESFDKAIGCVFDEKINAYNYFTQRQRILSQYNSVKIKKIIKFYLNTEQYKYFSYKLKEFSRFNLEQLEELKKMSKYDIPRTNFNNFLEENRTYFMIKED